MTTTERIVEAVKHLLPHEHFCNLNKNWDEARQALSDTPSEFRDADFYEAQNEIETLSKTCTCKYNELRAAITSVIGKDDWISVDESLPEPYKEVLTTDGNEVRSGYYDSEFKKMVMRMKYQVLTVTHWQPLPAPPKDLTPKTDTTDGK